MKVLVIWLRLNAASKKNRAQNEAERRTTQNMGTEKTVDIYRGRDRKKLLDKDLFLRDNEELDKYMRSDFILYAKDWYTDIKY